MGEHQKPGRGQQAAQQTAPQQAGGQGVQDAVHQPATNASARPGPTAVRHLDPALQGPEGHGQQRGRAIGQQRCHEAHAVHPDPWRPGTQQVNLGITGGAPGETGEPPPARQLRECPQGGKQQSLQPSRPGRPGPHCKGRERVVQGQRRGQRQHRQHRQPGWQPAVDVHGNEQPPEAARQPGRGKQAASPGRLRALVGPLKGQHQQGQGQPLPQARGLSRPGPGQGPVRPGPGQRSRLQQSGHQAQQGPDPGACPAMAARRASAHRREGRGRMQRAEQAAHRRLRPAPGHRIRARPVAA